MLFSLFLYWLTHSLSTNQFSIPPFSIFFNFLSLPMFLLSISFSRSLLSYTHVFFITQQWKKRKKKTVIITTVFVSFILSTPFIFSFLPVVSVIFFSRFLIFFLYTLLTTHRYIFLFSASVTPTKNRIISALFCLVCARARRHIHIFTEYTPFSYPLPTSLVSPSHPSTAATVAKTMAMLMMTMNDRNTDVLITHSLIHTLQQYVNTLFFFLLRLTAVPHPLPHNCSESPLPTEKVPPPTFTFSLPPFQTFTTEATHSIERAAKRVSAMATSSS